MKSSQYFVPTLAVLATAIGLVWALGGSCSAPQSYAGPILTDADLVPREVTIAELIQADLVQLTDGKKLRLSGLGENLNPTFDATGSRARLASQLVGRRFLLRPDPPRPSDPGELRGELWEVNGSESKSVNEQLLKSGDALLDLTHGDSAGDDRYLVAAREYANPRSRRAQTPLGFQCGVVLPLYAKDESYDYGARLKEIKDHGATWVSLLFVWMIDKMDGDRIAPKRNPLYRDENRSPSDEVLIDTIKKAKALGLRVLLLPVVLPYRPGPDDWRGNLRPKNRASFFENYGQYILRHADMAESLGVDAFSIGSELISLEGSKDPNDTLWWRRIARSTRQRFGGRITYSANWDHYDVLQILDELDFIGLTAYYSLTKDPDANVDALVEAWKPIVEELQRFSDEVKRPMVFTEVGYFSLRGTNTDPWNYKMEAPVDLAVQKRCYEAFARVFSKPGFLAGAYFFDWYDNGGTNDKSYTPRGKPAADVMKQFFSTAKNLPPPTHDPAR